MATSPTNSSDTNSDKDTSVRDHLVNFIQNSSLDEAVFPVIMGRKDTIPGAIPLLDIIRAHISKPDTWKFPTKKVAKDWALNRGIAPSILSEIDTREIVIGLTPNSDVENIRNWAENHFTTTENISPIGVLPCVVKYIPVTAHDVIRMGWMSLLGKTIPLQHSDEPPNQCEKHNFLHPDGTPIENRWIKFPAKLAIGDGRTWMLVLSIDITRVRDTQRCTIAPLQPALLQLLHQLPPLTGPDIKFAIVQFEQVFSQISGFKIRLPNFVELPSIATLAGWNMPTTSFDCISLLTTGTPQYSQFPDSAYYWAPRFTPLPDTLKILILAELKATFLAYNCFLISLREEVLPDPEIWCYLTGGQQRSVLTWWADWITAVLRGTTVAPEAAISATSRPELIRSLRATAPDGQILPHPPYRVNLMVNMTQGAATLTRGGCRFLHVERERALRNFAIAANEPITSSQHLFRSTVTDAKILYARYDQYSIQALDNKIPVPTGDSKTALVHHPRLPLPKVNIDVSKISVDYMLDTFRKLRRSQSEGILEWARENPLQINALFDAFAKSDVLAKKFRAIYDPVRLTALRLLNVHPVEVPFCEANLQKHMNNAVSDKQKVLDDINVKIQELSHARDRAEQELSAVKAEVEMGKSLDRSKWRGPAQPPPRHPRATEDEPEQVHDRVGSRPQNAIERNRRGVPPQERRRDHRFVIPERLPPRGVPIPDEINRWMDGDEDPGSGRAAVKLSKKRKAEFEPQRPARSKSLPPESRSVQDR